MVPPASEHVASRVRIAEPAHGDVKNSLSKLVGLPLSGARVSHPPRRRQSSAGNIGLTFISLQTESSESHGIGPSSRLQSRTLAAGSSARRAAGVEMRNHFPGGSELFDDKEASRFLH